MRGCGENTVKAKVRKIPNRIRNFLGTPPERFGYPSPSSTTAYKPLDDPEV
jgi:hypothetical protein